MLRPAALALLALMMLSATAAAHDNQPVAEGRYTIPARGAVELPAEIHWHRLVGEARVADGEGPLSVVVRGPGGRALVAGPANELRVNALVACCDDVGWAPHVVRLENGGARPLVVEAHLVFLHDGLGVAADDAETGAALSMLLFAGLPALLCARALRRGALREPAA
ncbi:MAG TPA: hypothetical protein VM582_02665, partial [Candidatus Thermoplasmatota archaeon]|nr:hypothetical protein [Candidatus Thermoplasmatota archaeon]